MAETLIELFGDIADAIRYKTGNSDSIVANDFPDAIRAIQTGTELPFAFIGVDYTAGEICTCTNGIITLTAEDTSGKYVFCVPSAGVWTVTAGSRFRTVSITMKNQLELVRISVVEIIANGHVYNDITGGWRDLGKKSVSGSSPRVISVDSITDTEDGLYAVSSNGTGSYNYNASIGPVNAIRLTDYSKIHYSFTVSCQFESAGSIQGWVSVITRDATYTYTGALASFQSESVAAPATRTYSGELDISNIVGEYDIAFTFRFHNTNRYGTLLVSELWLE